MPLVAPVQRRLRRTLDSPRTFTRGGSRLETPAADHAIAAAAKEVPATALQSVDTEAVSLRVPGLSGWVSDAASSRVAISDERGWL